jgi:hypothetical protein
MYLHESMFVNPDNALTVMGFIDKYYFSDLIQGFNEDRAEKLKTLLLEPGELRLPKLSEQGKLFFV